MDFKEITGFLDKLDPEKWMPNLESMMVNMEFFVSILVLLAPLVLFVLGVLYFFLPPREANHSFGYQFFWGKSSVEAWRFMQRVAGIVFGVVGLAMTVVMLILNGKLTALETMNMVYRAGEYLVWQLVAVAVSCIVIDIVMLVMFNYRGYRRGFTLPKEDKALPAEEDQMAQPDRG